MPKPPSTWKQIEREIADLFGGHRNPLSGSNNVADDGSKRIGDVLNVGALAIEIKYRKSISSIKRAEATRKDIKTRKHSCTNWIHIERMNGNKKTLLVACDIELFKKICKFIKLYNNGEIVDDGESFEIKAKTEY